MLLTQFSSSDIYWAGRDAAANIINRDHPELIDSIGI